MLDNKYYYDDKAVQRVIQFFEKFLIHQKTKEHFGKPFKLEPWQIERIIKPIFGIKRKDNGKRKHRQVYIEMGRKNGKSAIAAGIGCFMAIADGEPGAEVYFAATSTKQASECYGMAKKMLLASPDSLRNKCQFKLSEVVYTPTGSKLEVLSSEAEGLHGKNSHCNIIDELHVHRNSLIWDTLVSGTGNRSEPLTIAITTAGDRRNGVCWNLHQYAQRVLEDETLDEQFLPILFSADEKDDWQSEKTWRKCIPNLDVTISTDYIRQECLKAKNMPSYENTFRRLYLCQWQNQSTRWINSDVWAANGGKINLKDYEGKECFAGLDLSQVRDMTAFVLAFTNEIGGYDLIPFCFLPNADIQNKAQKDMANYTLWAKAGLLTLTNGYAIDYDHVFNKIQELSKIYNIREIVYDRWNASYLIPKLEAIGINCIDHKQGVGMSQACKEFERLLVEKKINHGNHPILNWQADNIEIKIDDKQNYTPLKAGGKDSVSRIDALIASIMAIGRASLFKANGQSKSIYETQGVMTF